MRLARATRTWIAGIWLGIGICLSLATADDTPIPPDLTARGEELEYLPDEQLIIYRGGVNIDYQDIFITADVVQLQVESLDIEAMGAVRFQRGDSFVEGEHLRGNLKAKTFRFDEFDGRFNLWQFKGGEAERQADGSFTITRASLTTCDDWWLNAREVEHRPNGDFTARHVTWSLFGVPMLYVPYVSGNTERWNASYFASAGHQSDWGAYLQVGRRWALGETGQNGQTKLWGDYRTKRGFALGNEGDLWLRNSFTSWHLYGMHDQDPPSDLRLGGRDYHDRFEVEEDRYRIHLFQRYKPFRDLTFMGNLDYISDNDLVIEFYDDIYNTYREPPTFLSAQWARERFDFTIIYRPRVNDFYTTVEQLPELRLDMPRQELFHSGIHYQSETSLAMLRANWREYDLPRNDGAVFDDYATWRFDTSHFLYYPLRIDWLNIVPRAGVRYTYYDRTSSTRVDEFALNDNAAADNDRARLSDTTPITNYTDDGGYAGRTAFELGVESSFKAYRSWHDYRSDRFALDGLRHVAEPYVNYTYITNPDEDKDYLYWFDEIDRIDNVNFVRVGMKHRLQTRRQNQIYTFVRAETFADYYYSPEGDQPQAGEIGQTVEFMPTQNLRFDAKMLVDYDNWDTNVVDAGIQIGDVEKLAIRLGYLFRDNYRTRYGYSMGSDLTQVGPVVTTPTTFDQNHNIRVTFDWQLTAKTHFQTEHYFDLNEGELTVQSYELSHEFRCWITSIELEENGDTVSVRVVLTMKGIGDLRVGG